MQWKIHGAPQHLSTVAVRAGSAIVLPVSHFAQVEDAIQCLGGNGVIGKVPFERIKELNGIYESRNPGDLFVLNDHVAGEPRIVFSRVIFPQRTAVQDKVVGTDYLDQLVRSIKNPPQEVGIAVSIRFSVLAVAPLIATHENCSADAKRFNLYAYP